MRSLGSSFIIVFLCVAVAVATQSDANVSYRFRVSGKIVFKKTQFPPGATVYVMGTRPISGRLPWTHAAKDGKFSIDFSDLPDDFRVCAHPGETSGLLPLAPTPEAGEKMTIKLSCTKDFRLDGDHRHQHVKLELK
ncbi:MAG TPA: hypothetical protein VJT71_08930 [Pyrinomonadaceae bacterium]|nr:hypothetical protein [Pyrinomonadaceae bacterium]